MAMSMLRELSGAAGELARELASQHPELARADWRSHGRRLTVTLDGTACDRELRCDRVHAIGAAHGGRVYGGDALIGSGEWVATWTAGRYQVRLSTPLTSGGGAR